MVDLMIFLLRWRKAVGCQVRIATVARVLVIDSLSTAIRHDELEVSFGQIDGDAAKARRVSVLICKNRL